MTESSTTECTGCGREILATTAERNSGMCKPCFRESNLSDGERFEREVFDQIDSWIEPFKSYSRSLAILDSKPTGYKYCFAIHYVNSDIFNGGISQLYSNSTWCLILDAIAAAETVGCTDIAKNFREIVFYYHKRNRSKLKRRINDDYFVGFDDNWDKSLQQLEDEYFDLEDQVNAVISRLCSNHRNLFE